MSFLGRYVKGDIVPLLLACVDASDVPLELAAAPSAQVYQDGGILKIIKLPVIDKPRLTGVFFFPLLLDANFSAGNHAVLFSWTIAGANYSVVHEFEVLASGNSEGLGQALITLDLPDSSYALMESISGRIKKMRNPRAL